MMVGKRLAVVAGGGLGVFALILGGVVVYAGDSQRSISVKAAKSITSAANRSTVHLEASWSEMYQSVATLKAHADVAVAGHFSKVFGETTDEAGIPYTDFAFVVESVLYDPSSKASGIGTVLRVHQTGGVVANVTEQISDDPLFAVNEKAVLFLREYQPGFYMVIGGPTGRFHESNSGDVTPSNGEGAKFSGSLASFAALVKNS